MSPGPFCPPKVPWPGAVRRAAHIWKNELTAFTRQLWTGKACEIGQDRKPNTQPTRNGWCAFLAAAMYPMWYRVWAGYLLNTEDLPLSQGMTIQWATAATQTIKFRFYFDEGAPPLANNIFHIFQIDPARIYSDVPWAFTRAIGQADDFDGLEHEPDVYCHPAWPFKEGDYLGFYVRETAGMTSWARYIHFTTAIA